MSAPSSTKRSLMQTYRVRAYCKCGGEWRNVGQGITTIDTAWRHRCLGCGKESWFSQTYPLIEHDIVGSNEEVEYIGQTRHEEIEHDELGCPIAKTGIYTSLAKRKEK